MPRTIAIRTIPRTVSILAMVGSSLIGTASPALGQSEPLAICSSFNPSMTGEVCGGSYARASDMVWVYGCFATTIEGYSTGGDFIRALTAPGGVANDADIDILTANIMLAGVEVPAGSLLFFDGETDVVEIYAIDPLTGDVLSTLVAEFGSSHVVGGSFHPGRGTIFVVEDRAAGNRVAEIDPATGAVLATFSTISEGFDVNYGDLETSEDTGNLLLVSSNERAIAEFSPDGALITRHELPASVTGLSGIGVSDTGPTWVFGVAGNAWELTDMTSSCPADLDGNGCLTIFDFLAFQNLFDAMDPAADFDGDGDFTIFDFLAFQNAFDAGCP